MLHYRFAHFKCLLYLTGIFSPSKIPNSNIHISQRDKEAGQNGSDLEGGCTSFKVDSHHSAVATCCYPGMLASNCNLIGFSKTSVILSNDSKRQAYNSSSNVAIGQLWNYFSAPRVCMCERKPQPGLWKNQQVQTTAPAITDPVRSSPGSVSSLAPISLQDGSFS